MIYYRNGLVDRVEITSFGRSIEEDATLMLIALRDIEKSMEGDCATQYEINWHVNNQTHQTVDSNGDRVEWCALKYTDGRWIYCHNNVCMQFTRDELTTSILYTMDDNVFVYLEGLLCTITSILVEVGIPEQYLFSRKQKEFLNNCGARRAMEERLIELNARVDMLHERVEQDCQYEQDSETNQDLCLMRESLETALYDRDNAGRFLAAINI